MQEINITGIFFYINLLLFLPKIIIQLVTPMSFSLYVNKKKQLNKPTMELFKFMTKIIYMRTIIITFILTFSITAFADDDLYGEDDIIEEKPQVEVEEQLSPKQQKKYLNQAINLIADKNYIKAREILFQIEKYKSPETYYQIGMLFNKGYGIAKDDKESAKYFLRAANLGHLQAQFTIAYMYEHGIGARLDGKEAYKWYLKAANQDMKKAQRKMGDLFYDGIGTKRDLEKAAYWYKKVADKGDLVAKKLYEKVMFDLKKGRIY